MAPPSTRARELLKKAPPRPPQQHRGTSTSSQPRASAGEVRVVSAERENANHKGKGKEVPVMSTEFNSQETPKPFLDPSIIQRRIQENRQYEISQRKRIEQQAPSPSG